MVAETQPVTDSNPYEIVSIFRERAKTLKRSASINLIMVIGLLIVGLYFSFTLSNHSDSLVRLTNLVDPNGRTRPRSSPIFQSLAFA
jgi:hypothetical protein